MKHRAPRELEPLPLIQHGGLTQKLLAALGVHGKVVAPQLGDVVHPVCVVEDLTRESFLSGSQSQKPCGATLDISPGAGLFGCAVLTNPANSGINVYLQQIIVGPTATNTFAVYIPGGVRTNIQAGYFRDMRILGAPQCTFSYENNLAVTDPGTILASLIATTTIQTVYQDVAVLGPGNSIGLRCDVAAVPLRTTFRWIEAPALGGRA